MIRCCCFRVSYRPFGWLVFLTLIGPLLVAIPSHHAHAQASGIPDTSLVRVRVRVNAAYDDSKASVENLRQLSAALPPVLDSLSRPLSLDSLILTRFRVAAGPVSTSRGYALPETRALLRDQIRSMNRLAHNAIVVPAGRILLPAIPARALERPNPAKKENNVAQIMTTRALDRDGVGKWEDARSTEDVLFTSFEVVAGARARPAARNRVVEVELPAAVVERLYDENPAAFDEGLIEVGEMGFLFDVEQPPVASTAPVTGNLPVALLDSVRTLTADARHRRVPLLILDSGWPNGADYDYSRRRLATLFDSLRGRWGLGTRPVRAKPQAFEPPSFPHVVSIATSLATLRRVADSSFVDVIFVPLAREQDADPVLRELLFLDGLLTLKRGQLVRSAETNAGVLDPCYLNEDEPSTYARCVRLLRLSAADTAVVQRKVDSLVRALPLKHQRDDGTRDLRSSTAVVAAAWRLLDALSDSGNVGFVSISWVVSLLRGSLNQMNLGQDRVFLIAAAGNDSMRVINGSARVRDFAGRSVTSKAVLAVLNTDPQGTRLCGSSTADTAADRITETLVVSFYGVTENGDCGTSFAAPRVAWLLALDESLRSSPRDGANWIVSERRRILKLREPTAGLRGLFLHPVRLFMSGRTP
jgi:hypothetical protein